FLRDAGFWASVGRVKQAATALMFRVEGGLGRYRHDDVPGFGRRHQSHVTSRFQIGAEIAGAPQGALEVIASTLLDPVNDVGQYPGIDGKGGSTSVEIQSQGSRIVCLGPDFNAMVS